MMFSSIQWASIACDDTEKKNTKKKIDNKNSFKAKFMRKPRMQTYERRSDRLTKDNVIRCGTIPIGILIPWLLGE